MDKETSGALLFVIMVIFIMLTFSLLNNFVRDRCFEKGGVYYSARTGCTYRREIEK